MELGCLGLGGCLDFAHPAQCPPHSCATGSEGRAGGAGGVHAVTVMLVDFCRHLVGKTLRHVCHRDSA